MLLAGGTDLGLLITKQLRDLDNVVYLGNVSELRQVDESETHTEFGGAVTYAEAQAALTRIHPDIGELVRRLGGAQVRACGTLAGNIANGSPIGDSMPFLLALGSTVVLQRGKEERTVALDNFYTGYRKSVLEPGEFIRSIRVPKLAPGARFAAYKISKRFDQDISAVCAAFHAASGKARFAFGGMAPTPTRAPRAEAAFSKGVEAACTALAEDFEPLSDHRASAWYRLTVAQNLLRKFAMGVSSREILDL
jgi:xanthine dehydrogenase small subunit